MTLQEAIHVDWVMAFYLFFAVVFFVLLIVYPIGWLARRRFRIWRARRRVRRHLRHIHHEDRAARDRRRQQAADGHGLFGEPLIAEMRLQYDGNRKPLRMVPKKMSGYAALDENRETFDGRPVRSRP